MNLFKKILFLTLIIPNLCLSFDGITIVEDIQIDRVTVRWDNQGVPGSEYRIYDATSGEPYSLITTRPSNSSQATITGLNPSTEYSILVRFFDGVSEDTNTAIETFTTLTPASPLFSGSQVSARTGGEEDVGGVIGNIVRMEFFDNGIFESDDGTNVTQNSYTATIIPTSLDVKSCINFVGQNEIFSINLNLGFGNLVVNTHRINGTCDGQAVNCFVFQSTDTNGDQRLMEVTPGGCNRLLSDFNESGDLLVESVTKGSGGVKNPNIGTDVSSFRVRGDNIVEVIGLPGGVIERVEMTSFSSFTFERDILPCDSWSGSVSSYSIDSTSINGEIYDISGTCNGSPVSCVFIDESSINEISGVETNFYRKFNSNGICGSAIDSYFVANGNIMGDPVISGHELTQIGNFTKTPIERLRIFDNEEGAQYNTSFTEKEVGSPASSFVTDSTRVVREMTVPSCNDFDGEIYVRDLNKFNDGMDTSVDDPLEQNQITYASGACDGVRIECFELGFDILDRDVLDEYGNVISSPADNFKRLFEGIRGVCPASYQADFTSKGSGVAALLLDIVKMDESLRFTSFSNNTSRLMELPANTVTISNSPFLINETVFATPELKYCREFFGDKRLYSGDILGVPFEVIQYEGNCDAKQISCYVKKNLSTGTSELYRSRLDPDSCSGLELDFNSTGQVEGIAGSTAPPPPIPEFIPEIGAKAYTFSVTNETLTLGLNPITKEPLVGSDWEVLLSDAFVGNCTQYDEHVFDDGDKISTVFSYLDPNIANCNTASHPKDPLNQIEWDNMGVTREAQHGTETIVCGRDNACDITMSINFREQVFSSLNPTQGVDGTAPGRGRVFVYDFKQVSTSNEKGEGGLGGLANLPINPITEKYCVDLSDLVTEGGGSSFAENPVLNMEVIQWEPFRQGGNAAQGVTPAANDERSFIMKGLSEGMLYYIKRDNIYLGTEWEE